MLRDFASGGDFRGVANRKCGDLGCRWLRRVRVRTKREEIERMSDLVPSLEGKRTIMVACRLGQTLFLVKSEDVKEGVPVFTPLPEAKGSEKKNQGADMVKPGGAKKAKK